MLHPPHPRRCQELRRCPWGPRCFLGCRFTCAVLRGRLCPDPSPGDPEAPRTLTSPFPGGRGSQAEAVRGAAEQKSGADGHSVSQAWVPRGPMHGHYLVTPLLLSYLIFSFRSDEFPAFLNKSVHSGATYFNRIPHPNGITRV